MTVDVLSGSSSWKALTDKLENDFNNAIAFLSRELKNIAKVTSSEEYECLQKVGQGTFGEVFKARHKRSKQHCALKRIKKEQENEGFPITAIREIRLLRSLQHENIVCLKDVCYSAHNGNKVFDPQFFLVFEFCDYDILALNHKVEFPNACKKSIMKQLLTGLYYLHKNHIIHRDLKTANILINKQGVLKIADFGLARDTLRSLNPNRQPRYTEGVVTLWYRPPEVLLGERHYGKPVDLWGVGCVMAELWTRYPIMQGNCDLEQLKLIINLCGSINPKSYPGVERLGKYSALNLPKDIRRHVRERLKDKVKVPSAIDLIDRLLAIDPKQRPTAVDALMHDYFYEEPAPGGLGAFMRECCNSRQAMQQPLNRQFAVPQLALQQHVNPVSRQSRHHHYDQQRQQQIVRRDGGGRPVPPTRRLHPHHNHHPYMFPQQSRSRCPPPPPPLQDDHIHERFY